MRAFGVTPRLRIEMSDAIKKLIKNSNSSQDAYRTINNAEKLCNALEIAVEALNKIYERCDEPTSLYAEDALQKMQTIAEKTNG
jgi:hypothetical protein